MQTNKHKHSTAKKWQALRLFFVAVVAIVCVGAMFSHDESDRFSMERIQRVVLGTSDAKEADESVDRMDPQECLKRVRQERDSAVSLSSWMTKNPSMFEGVQLFDWEMEGNANEGQKMSSENLRELVHRKKLGETKFNVIPLSVGESHFWLVSKNNLFARVDGSECRISAMYFPKNGKKHPAVTANKCGRYGKCARKKTDGHTYSCEVPAGGEHCPAHFFRTLTYSQEWCNYDGWDPSCGGMKQCPGVSSCFVPICPLQTRPVCMTQFQSITPTESSRALAALGQVLGFVNALKLTLPPQLSQALSVVSWFVTGQAGSGVTATQFNDLYKNIKTEIEKMRACIVNMITDVTKQNVRLGLLDHMTAVRTDLKPENIKGKSLAEREKQHYWDDGWQECTKMGGYFQTRFGDTRQWEVHAYILPLAVEYAQLCEIHFMAMVADWTALKRKGELAGFRNELHNSVKLLYEEVTKSIAFIQSVLMVDGKCAYFKDQSDLLKEYVGKLNAEVLTPVRNIYHQLRVVDTEWVQVPGWLSRAGITPSGVIYGIGWQSVAFVKISWNAAGWVGLPGSATDISVNEFGQVMKADPNGRIYYRNKLDGPWYPSSGDALPGGRTAQFVGWGTNSLYAVSTDNLFWRKKNLHDTWVQPVSGEHLKEMSVKGDLVVGLTMQGHPKYLGRRLTGFKLVLGQLKGVYQDDWLLLGGLLKGKCVSRGMDGDTWAVGEDGSVWWYAADGPVFVRTSPIRFKCINVANKNKVIGVTDAGQIFVLRSRTGP